MRIRVPGKIILAGEYAVLTRGSAIVCAIDRYLECEAEAATRIRIAGNGACWEEGEEENAALQFALQALGVTQDYLLGRRIDFPKIAITLRDELRTPQGTKLGLGGSACTCVAVVAAVLAVGKVKVTRETVFKLAAVAHGEAQEQPGSAVDIAASVFGGTLWTYRMPMETLRLARKLGPEVFASQIEEASVPTRQRLADPPGLLLAFAGVPASTGSLVEQINAFRKGYPEEYAVFLAGAGGAVEQMKSCLKKENWSFNEQQLDYSVGMAQKYLEQLGDQSKVSIVTDAHRKMMEIAREKNISMKISGAGGGDCALAIGRTPVLVGLQTKLEQAGFYSWLPQVDSEGFKEV